MSTIIIKLVKMFLDEQEIQEKLAIEAFKNQCCCVGQCKVKSSKGGNIVKTFLGIPQSVYGDKGYLEILENKEFGGRVSYSDPKTETYVYQMFSTETEQTPECLNTLEMLLLKTF